MTLQEKLEQSDINVHKRTIQRDLNSLSLIFPLQCDEFRPKGWFWSKDAKIISIPGMDQQTALTFKLVEKHLKHLLPSNTLNYLQPYFVASARLLEDAEKTKISRWTDKVCVISHGISTENAEIDPEVLRCVYEALMEEKQFQVFYKPRGKTTGKQSIVNTLGLVFRDSLIYLVSTFDKHDKVWQLPLHRMSKSVILETNRHVPNGFNLDQYIEDGAFQYILDDNPILFKAIMIPDAAVCVQETPLSKDQQLEILDDKRIKVIATVMDSVKFRRWLLGFGDRIEILEPTSLRKSIAEIAENMFRQY